MRQLDGNGHVPAPSAMSEADLDERIETIALDLGLRSVHVPDSRRVTARGWPDRVYLGPGGVLFRELKPEGGTLRHSQRQVGYLLQAAGLDWAVWRPLDLRLGRVIRELTAIA